MLLPTTTWATLSLNLATTDVSKHRATSIWDVLEASRRPFLRPRRTSVTSKGCLPYPRGSQFYGAGLWEKASLLLQSPPVRRQEARCHPASLLLGSCWGALKERKRESARSIEFHYCNRMRVYCAGARGSGLFLQRRVWGRGVSMWSPVLCVGFDWCHRIDNARVNAFFLF